MTDEQKARDRARLKAWREAHKTEQAAKKRAYYLARRDAIIARSQAYYDTHRAEVLERRKSPAQRAYNKAYWAAHKAERSEANRAYCAARQAAQKATHPARICPGCTVELPATAFTRMVGNCKTCSRSKELRNKDARAVYARSPERRADIARAFARRKADPLVRDHDAAVAADWRRRNSHLVRAAGARRKAQQLQATPWWTDRAAIAVFYREAIRLTKDTGIIHEVDHIVPLRSPLVCGLHVAHNLRVMTKADNRQKSNHLMLHIALPQSLSAAAPR